MTVFLSPVRRTIELLVGAYGTGFGLYVWFGAKSGDNLLAWAGLNYSSGLWVAQLMSLAGLVHIMGVKINGKWRWSPFIRLAGILVHVALLSHLVSSGIEAFSTAGYTYGFIFILFLSVLWYVATDCISAVRRGAWKAS